VPRFVFTFAERWSTLRFHGSQAQSAVSRSDLSPSFAKATEGRALLRRGYGRAGVMNRGDRREAIFHDEQDRLLFLDTLGEACQKTDWQLHAWCLMSNGLMETRRRAEGLGDFEPEGWCLGSEEFRQELLAQVSEQASPRHAGEEVRESALAKAERIAQQELTAMGWASTDLKGHRKSDPRKVAMAVRLRQETTMTLEWIATRLGMGTSTHLASLLQRQAQKGQECGKTLF